MLSMSADARPTGYVRTTISLREDIYQKLKRTGRSLSDEVNEILAREFTRDHSLFGTAKRVSRHDVRDRNARV